MDDRGEKIVDLAHEMLRAEEIGNPPELTVREPISFKVLCVAKLLAAFGSGAITAWVDESRRRLNHYEKVELDALVFYAARLKGLNEDAAVRREIESRVGVGDFGDFTERNYRIAKNYLHGEIN